MDSAMQQVTLMVRNARVDTCPYDGGSNKTAYFIRIGPNGHWLSNARKSVHAAWRNAAARLKDQPADETDAPKLNLTPAQGERLNS